MLLYIIVLPALSIICHDALPVKGDTTAALNSFDAGLGDTVIVAFVIGRLMLIVFEYLNEPLTSVTFNL